MTAETPTVACNGRVWTLDTLAAFKDAYGAAVTARQAVFTFDGREFYTAGSRRLINFVEETLTSGKSLS